MWVLAFAAFALQAEPEFRTIDGDGYRYFEFRMPADDGVELYTYGVVPTNGVKCPVILMRTPYDAKAFKGVEDWAKHAGENILRGYARVVQQCRGSALSGGVRIPYVDERRDSLAAIRFLRTLPCYDGEIYLSGGSYLSSVHWAYLDDCPPDVKGAMLNIQCADRYPVVMHNGFLKIGLHAGWYLGQYKSNDKTLTRHRETTLAHIPLCDFTKRYFGDGKEGPLPGLDDVIAHPRPEDPFWRLPGGGGGEYRNGFTHSKIPILMVTGWYDIYADGLCDQWREASAERKANCALMIDAFNHDGKRHDDSLDPSSAVHFPDGSRHDPKVRVPDFAWFDYLRGGPCPSNVKVGEVTWYNLWENAWHHAKGIPEGKFPLTLAVRGAAERTFRYDPRHPAKFPLGCGIGFGWIRPMPGPDFRPDVLTYVFEPASRQVDVAGRMNVALRVRSDCEDTAFYVRVSVKKAGTEKFYGLRESIKALTWDEGDYVPGSVRTLRFDLADIAFRLGKGDVLRLDVSSSNVAMFTPHTNVKGVQAYVREPKVAVNAVLAEGSSLTLPTSSCRE